MDNVKTKANVMFFFFLALEDRARQDPGQYLFTNTGGAIDEAVKMFKQSKKPKKILFIFTDGNAQEHDKAVKAANNAR